MTTRLDYDSAMRLALGCQRISERATIDVAYAAGIRLFDTARAYGESERMVGEALAGTDALVVTKCGMRPDWTPDGRATAVRADIAASRAALGGAPIDTLLLHVPDPGVSLATSLRALAAARDAGIAKRIGLSNVTLRQLEEARATGIEIQVVEVALGAYDDGPARGGVVGWCAAQGVLLLAHSPFGGPTRSPRLARDQALQAVASRIGASPHEVALAYLLAVHPAIVPIVGARRPESVHSAIRATALVLDAEALAILDERFRGLGMLRAPKRTPKIAGREIVMLAGIPGAGKSRAAATWMEKGYERLNRDELGGTLRGIAKRLDDRMSAGGDRFVLDNTYVTRKTRSEIVRLSQVHGATLRCQWFDTPPHEAQRNLIQRILERHDGLPIDLASVAKRDPAVLAPNVLARMLRDLERPAVDEGFDALDIVPFTRVRRGARPGTAIACSALDRLGGTWPGTGPILIFDWASAPPAPLSIDRPYEVSICPHPAGAPTCWCRPPSPGLWLAFAHKHDLATEESVLVGTTATHRLMAEQLGMTYAAAPS